MSVAGTVTYEYDLYNVNPFQMVNPCFYNEKEIFLPGEYTEWNCFKPYPIGRLALLYHRDYSAQLQIYEFTVLAAEITELSYHKIQISDLSSVFVQTISSADQYNYITSRVLDGNILNVLDESPSCTGINGNLKKLIFDFKYTSVIYFIGIFVPRKKGFFSLYIHPKTYNIF